MTVIRPNSISGITSITAQANEINIFRSDGTLAGLQINGINFNNTSGISTLAALNVTGNVSIAGTLTYEDVTNVDSIGIITARSAIDAQGSINLADSLIHTGDTDTKITFDTNTIKFDTAGTERLIITSDGKVGINSTTPNTKLDVISSSPVSRTWTPGSSVLSMFERNGHCRIALVSSATSYSEIDFADANDDNSGYIRYDNSDNSMSFRTNGSGEALTVDAYGRVLIGGTSAIIGSSSEFNEIVLTGKTRGAGITLQDVDANTRFQIRTDDNGDGTLLNASTNHPLVIRTNNTERLRIDSSGRVGIGTISPTYGLDIMHDTGLMIRSSTNAVGAAISFTDASTNNWDQIGTIKYFHQNNIVENGTNEGFIIQGTESTTAVKIEGLLRVTAQPCAVVYQCTGPAGGAANATSDNQEPLHFDHVHINQGGMTISQNNARIQVPVTGIYFVSYMVSGTVTNPDDNDGIELILLRNGSEYPASNSGAEPVFNFGLTANREEFFCNNTLLVSLSKDDYVEVAVDNIGSSDANINRGNFNVMLMA